MPPVLDILYYPDAPQASGSVSSSNSSGSRPATSPSTILFRLHLSNASATIIDFLPFDDIISGLNLTPSSYYTAELYPEAVLVDSTRPTPYRLSVKNILVAGRPASRMVFKKLSTANALTLRLGERDVAEWERVEKEQDAEDFQQWEMDNTPPPSTPVSPDSSVNDAGPPPYLQLVQPAPAPVSAPPSFMLSSSDVEVATVLSMAMEHDNPVGWLQSTDNKWNTAAVSSLLTEWGDRVLNVSGAAQPYLLALSRNDPIVHEFGNQLRQQQLDGDTLWVVFPSNVELGDDRAVLRMLGRSPSALGRVHGGVHSRIESITTHIREFATEYRKRRTQKAGSKPWRIIFTGHSAGGTLAQVACLQLLSESLLDVSSSEQVGVIAFASPFVVSDEVHSYLSRQGWNDHFLTIVEQGDVIPQLLTSAFAFDLDMQQVLGHRSQAAAASNALTTLFAKKDKKAIDTALRQLGEVSRLVAAPGRQHAAPIFSPVGVYAMIESHSEGGFPSDTPRYDWQQLALYQNAANIQQKLAKASPGATIDISPHSIGSLCSSLASLRRGQQSALFQSLNAIAVVSQSVQPILQSLFKPTLEALSVQVTGSTVLMRLAINNQAFLRADCQNTITWTVESYVAVIPPMGSAGSSASLRVIDEQQIELRIKANVNLALLDSQKYSRSSLTLQTVFKQPASASIDNSTISQLPDSDNNELRSLSDELFFGGLLRVFFEVTSGLQHLSVADGQSDQKLSLAVSNALDQNRKMRLYKELFSVVLDSDELGNDLETKVKNAVLTELKARKAALAAARTVADEDNHGADNKARVERAKKEIEAAGSMSTKSRETFKHHVKPLVDLLTMLLQSPAAYELQPGWFRWLGRGAFKVVKVTSYIGFAVAGVVVVGGVVLLGPAAWAGAAGVGAMAGEVAIATTAIGGEAAIRYLIGSKGAGWLANLQENVGGDAGTAYRAHLLMLLAALNGKDGPNTMLFTASDVERAILDRLRRLRPSLYEQLADTRPALYVRSMKNSRNELKACWDAGVFKRTSEDKDASLGRFTGESQVKALRFLRAVSCIHQLRKELSHAVYLSIAGAKDVGKSTLVNSLFRIPTKQGALIQDTTLSLNMYPLFDHKELGGVEAAVGSSPAFYLLDTPGMTDANEDVASAFRDAKAMVSLHLVLGKAVVGGARPETDILTKLGPALPALVILNALETYAFPPCYSLSADGTVPISFYRNHLLKLRHDAAIRLNIPDDNIFLLYNDRLYSDSQHKQTQLLGKGFDGLPYLKEQNIDALKEWLVKRIANHLHMKQHEAAIKKYIDYEFK
jgi:hypothetical protein